MPKTPRCENSMPVMWENSLAKGCPLDCLPKKSKRKTTPKRYKGTKHVFEAYLNHIYFIYLKQYLKTTLDVIFLWLQSWLRLLAETLILFGCIFKSNLSSLRHMGSTTNFPSQAWSRRIKVDRYVGRSVKATDQPNGGTRFGAWPLATMA